MPFLFPWNHIRLPPVCVDIRLYDDYAKYESEKKEMEEADRNTKCEEEEDEGGVFFDPRASVLEIKRKFLCWAHGLKVIFTKPV